MTTPEEAKAAGELGDYGPLVALVRDGSEGEQQQAASALANLAAKADQVAIAAGTIEPLVAIVSGGGSEGSQKEAAWVLFMLAFMNADNRAAIAAAGAIEPLVALARGGSEGAKEYAAAALWNLAFNNADNRAEMERFGYTP